jgi:hypothetical protein
MANPYTDTVMMAALAQVVIGIPPNTRVGTLGNPVIVEDEYTLSKGRFPAMHIETERQKHKILTTGGYDGMVRFIISYYDKWDKSTARIDDIRKAIKTDLEIVMANVQGNSSLAIGGQAMATAAYEFVLSPYKGELDDKTIPGLTLVKRTLRVAYNILPYDA